MSDSRKILIFLTFIILSFNCVTCALAGENVDGTIEIFVGGKRYHSIFEYRRERLIGFLEKVLPSVPQVSRGRIVDQLLSAHSPRQLEQMTTSELLALINYTRETTPSFFPKQVQDDKVVEMQVMLDEHFERRIDEQPLTVDPNKVKTVIINPSP